MSNSQNYKRLDVWLVDNKYFSSRNVASNAIFLGLVSVNGQVTQKSSTKITQFDAVTIDNSEKHYVSRAANKLKYLITKTKIDIERKTCIDLGASTGGFTQILLEFGASKIYAIDVGHEQMANQLRKDQRVINMDRTDARDIGTDIIQQSSIITADLSFISLRKVLGQIVNLSNIGTTFCVLFKPQFEVGQKEITKNGIVKNTEIVWSTLQNFKNWLENINIGNIKIFKSPILGKEGNQEWLVCGERI